jgi:hypothetical protein
VSVATCDDSNLGSSGIYWWVGHATLLEQRVGCSSVCVCCCDIPSHSPCFRPPLDSCILRSSAVVAIECWKCWRRQCHEIVIGDWGNTKS